MDREKSEKSLLRPFSLIDTGLDRIITVDTSVLLLIGVSESVYNV